MAVQNPDYKPDWEAIHDHSDAERTRISDEQQALQDQMNELYEQGVRYDDPAYAALMEAKEALQPEWDKHHETCKRCLDTYQHETIQDGARWLFEHFDPNMGAWKTNTVHAVDFDSFTTMDEVFAAWSEASEISDQIEAEATGSLPIGRPDGKDIFENTGSNQIASAWQDFDIRELHPDGYFPRGGHVHTLVTIDQRDGEYHICFMQDPDKLRGGSPVQYEAAGLATVMYQRIYMAQMQEKQKTLALPGSSMVRGLLSRLTNLVSEPAEKTPEMHPGQFNFYLHTRPHKYWGETFQRVDMDFENGRFTNPDHQHLHVIPEILQKAYSAQKDVSAKLVDAPAIEAPVERLDYDGDT